MLRYTGTWRRSSRHAALVPRRLRFFQREPFHAYLLAYAYGGLTPATRTSAVQSPFFDFLDGIHHGDDLAVLQAVALGTHDRQTGKEPRGPEFFTVPSEAKQGTIEEKPTKTDEELRAWCRASEKEGVPVLKVKEPEPKTEEKPQRNITVTINATAVTQPELAKLIAVEVEKALADTKDGGAQ